MLLPEKEKKKKLQAVAAGFEGFGPSCCRRRRRRRSCRQWLLASRVLVSSRVQASKNGHLQEVCLLEYQYLSSCNVLLLIYRLEEEADYKSTTELFAKRGDEKTLDNFIPKSESDFTEYAELVSHKLRPYEKSFHYIGLLKAVMRLSMTSLKAADAKEVASSVTAIANEKLKAEKEANAGKKKPGAKKKQLHVDKADDDVAVDGYEAMDDYDFM
ncbi:eukaryotic translation initiation factor 3 subunit J-like [Macadamia integrifolia]|uniref:eukaryotic translation initiation factor 3 subunit J-like n=1 Tax=Macadamia integrifolia TaxID=60698 RepID=UPI001C501ED2|nr:eukaryotic translation initiation factor 3 subunit J-like [Macadamia integrifolia]